MKRRNFKATVVDSNLTIIEERNTFAWNSAITATESIVRDYTRASNAGIFNADRPLVTTDRDKVYRRIWTNAAGKTFTAMVWEVF